MVKTPSKNPEYSREREFKVILEDIQKQFRVFGEGQQALTQTVRQLDQKVDGMVREISNLRIEFIQMKGSMDRFFVTLSDHEGRIITLESRP